MHQDDHSRPHHGIYMDLMGETELVQHVHLVSCWCNDLEALASFNTQWMDYNVLHFPRCTFRSQNFGERKRNKKNPESDLCWGNLQVLSMEIMTCIALYAIATGVLSSLVSGRLPSLSGIGYHCQTPAPRNLREENGMSWCQEGRDGKIENISLSRCLPCVNIHQYFMIFHNNNIFLDSLLQLLQSRNFPQDCDIKARHGHDWRHGVCLAGFFATQWHNTRLACRASLGVHFEEARHGSCTFYHVNSEGQASFGNFSLEALIWHIVCGLLSVKLYKL